MVGSAEVYSYVAEFRRTFIDVTITAIYPAAGLFLRDTRRRGPRLSWMKRRVVRDWDGKTGVGC